MAKGKISPEAFIKAWQGASSLQGAATATKLSTNSARSRAATYRKKGIALKSFADGRGGSHLDIAGLKALATKFAPKGSKSMAARRSKRSTKRSKKKK